MSDSDGDVNSELGTTLCRDVRLYHGTVLINSIDCTRRTRNVRVYEISLMTKYATVLSQSSWSGAIEVIFHVDENTLYRDATTDIPTTVCIRVPGNVDRWNIMAECTKSTARIVVWRRSKWLVRRARVGEWFVSLARRVTDVVDTIWETSSE